MLTIVKYYKCREYDLGRKRISASTNSRVKTKIISYNWLPMLIVSLNPQHFIDGITTTTATMNTNCNPEIIVLFDGYSHFDNSTQVANCTCTLIKGPPHIIIDTMTAWDGPKLLQALSTHKMNAENISYVICTHGHSDHIGCNYLFTNATHIVGFSISHRDKYFEHDFLLKDYVISEKIKVMATPGHTLQDVSVVVHTDKGVIAITGDLFENGNDLEDESVWKNAGSDSVELQEENRKKILAIADYIIPGHGPMFKVEK